MKKKLAVAWLVLSAIGLIVLDVFLLRSADENCRMLGAILRDWFLVVAFLWTTIIAILTLTNNKR